MIKLIFGFPVHEKFEIALDLYFTIRKFNNNPLVLFSSNQDLGNSVDNLKRVPSKRVYGYGFMHNFVFDMCEVLEDMDFDYFVKLDSDSLFANYGFEKIFEKKFDFCAQIEKDGALEWNWGKNLFKNLKSYLRLLDDLGLRRKNHTMAGALSALQIYSKRTIKFIAENIKTIEKNKGYAELMLAVSAKHRVCLSDALPPNLLKDAGFTFIPNPFTKDLQEDTGFVRWRPYWDIEEVANKDISKLAIIYHPVKRDLNDPFRKYIMKKIKLRNIH